MVTLSYISARTGEPLMREVAISLITKEMRERCEDGNAYLILFQEGGK